VIHVSLVTTRKNKPLISEIHFVFDNNLHFYFRSLRNRRHTLKIEENHQIAGSIVKQYALNAKPRGIYFDGHAEFLQDMDNDHSAFILYCQRFGSDDSIIKEAQNPEGHKFCTITVNTFYVFDAQESTPSQKYELKWIE